LKENLIIILTLIGFVAFGQENKLDQIKDHVESIESDSTLTLTEFDWVELTGITTDGGGILKVWRNENQIYKIVEQIGLSYGRVSKTIYLKDGVPIKIIDKEENWFYIDDSLKIDYSKGLKEVFKATIYVFDWESDDAKIEQVGERVMSEGTCSTFDYEPIVKSAKKAIVE
jgi:hypothetical protein